MQPLHDQKIKNQDYPPKKPYFSQSNQGDAKGKHIFWVNSDPFTKADLKNAETFLILGATGSGKTTIINAFANYLWGVEYKDDYRYKIVKDETNCNTTVS